MHSDETIVASRARGDLGDRKGRGIRCEQRIRRADSVERCAQRVLYFQVLEYRFVGRTLVLRDREANLIVDYAPEVAPPL